MRHLVLLLLLVAGTVFGQNPVSGPSLRITGNGTVGGDLSVTGLLTSINVKRGSGSPEGSVTGAVGAIYQRTNGSTGTTLYIKESGSGNTGWVAVSSGGSGAPADATYITQTPNSTLSAEQALSALSSGIMRVATTTGVVTSLTDSSGIAANISDETGSGALVFGTSPVLTTPNLGTPSAVVLTNATGFPGETGKLGVHGADIASASTINLETATGDAVDVTGTTTITAITLNEGHSRWVRFTGTLTLTNGASLILLGGADVTTAAGNYSRFTGYAGGVVRETDYSNFDSTPRYIYPLNYGTNPGAATLVDNNITSASSAGTEHSYAVKLDGATVAKFYTESDGSGGIQNSTFTLTAGTKLPITTKTANYTATLADHTILVDATSGAVTITLPTAASASGLVYNIKKIDSSGNNVVIDGASSETVDGATTKTTSTQWTNFAIQSNGTAWFIL